MDSNDQGVAGAFTILSPKKPDVNTTSWHKINIIDTHQDRDFGMARSITHVLM